MISFENMRGPLKPKLEIVINKAIETCIILLIVILKKLYLFWKKTCLWLLLVDNQHPADGRIHGTV